MKKLYTICVIVGVGIALYIFGIAFDNFSEQELLWWAPVWFLSLVFGIYGFITDKLIRLMKEKRVPTLRHALFLWFGGFFGPISLALFFPFLILKGKNSLSISITGTIIWGILLAVFIFGIFPAL